MKLIAQIAAGVALAILAVWLMAALAVRHGPGASRTSSSDSAHCDDSAVIAATANNLAEWLNQKIIVHGNGDLHLKGDLLTQISTSVSVGRLQHTEQCLANASIGFKDAAGTLHSAEPVSIRFDVTTESNGTPKITFNEASLLEDGGAYDATASLLVAEDQRPTSQWAPAQAAPAATSDESTSNGSSGSDLCRVVALVRVPSIEDPESALPPGETHDSVTQYRVSKKTGAASFCTHGGYCYPRFITIGGKMTEALQLQNCRIGGKTFEDEDETIYSVDLDRLKNSQADLKYNDLTNTLLTMGLCNACAGNAAQYYVQKPTSECGLLVKSALEGDPASKKKLLESPDYCHWRW